MNHFAKVSIKIILLLALIMIVFMGMASSKGGVSPPVIRSPIYAEARVVGVSGFEPNAEINLFRDRNGVIKQIGKRSFWYTYCEIEIDKNERLYEGDVIFATQTIGGLTSAFTLPVDRVTVAKLPGTLILPGKKLDKPTIIDPVTACQRIIRARDIVPGATVTVYPTNDPSNSVSSDTPYDYNDLVTSPLVEGNKVGATQKFGDIAGPSDKAEKPVGPKVGILPDCIPYGDSLVKGATIVTVDKCYPGAELVIYSGSNRIGGGIVPAESVVVPINPPLEMDGIDKRITAKQFLCGQPVGGSPWYDVADSIKKPLMEMPLCPDSDRVTVCNTVPGAIVEVFYENGKRIAGGGSRGGCINLSLDDVDSDGINIALTKGTKIYAVQTLGAVEAKSEFLVEVGKSYDPIFQIDYGFCYGVFVPEMLLRKNGPVFRVIKCGGQEPSVEVFYPDGKPLFKPPTPNKFYLKQDPKKKGYFEGTWDWNNLGWQNPNDIPRGTYTAKFKIGQIEKDKHFSVYPSNSVELEVLCAHNKYREEVHAENPSVPPLDPLTWSDSLAKGAQDWADHLKSIGKMEHSSTPGENLSSIGNSYTDAIKSWADEKENLLLLWRSAEWNDQTVGMSQKFPDAKPGCSCPGNCKDNTFCYMSKTCDFCDFGHYTQIVWRDTTEVGCGANGYRACRYAPAGNTWSAKVY